MAKKKAKVVTKTINGTDECQIYEKSENTVWVYGDSSVSLRFRYVSAANPQYELESNMPIFIRKGNDLVFLSIYRNKSTYAIKEITNTVKNYFTSDKDVAITAKISNETYQVEDYLYTNTSGYTWDTSSTKTNFFFGSKKNDSYHTSLAGGVRIIDEAGKDTYDIRNTNGNSSNNIFDMKGNDKYYLASKKTGSFADGIRDYEGNDKYKIANSTKAVVYDYKGKDSYEAYGSNATIFDYKGNDKYVLDNTDRGSGVVDYEGNDSYKVSNITSEGNFLNINEYKGNDKYIYKNLTSDTNKNITEYSGKDTYNISGANYITIQDNSDYDKKRTDDTYNISNSSRIFIKENSSEYGKKIASGNDKYNFNGVDNSSLTESDFIHQKSTAITDSAGNDKYNIKNSTDVGFDDKKGNDTWNIISSKNTIVSDSDGKDKWNIVSSTATSDYTLTDQKGNDVWAISNSNSIYATDKAGTDKYTISNNSMDIHLTDNGGNDKYTIKDSTDLLIDDKGKSNDVYSFNNYISSLKFNYYFVDDGGKDSYTINNSRSVAITNESGNTTYSVNNSRSTDLIDVASTKEADSTREKNTFNIKNSSMTIIKTNFSNYDDDEISKIDTLISNDIYNITSSVKTWIYDYDFGTDTYNIKSNKGGTIINDKGGDDKYTVDKLVNDIKITDGYGNDSLVISKAKAKNLVFMANYNTSTNTDAPKNDVKNGSLFIFDKSTKGYIEISNYFVTKTDSFGRNFLNGAGSGNIENIKAGKTNVTSKINAYAEPISGSAKYDELGAAVAGWLNDNGFSTDDYTSVDQILSSDISEQFLAFVSKQ